MVILTKEGYLCLHLHTGLHAVFDIVIPSLGADWYWRCYSKRIVVVEDQLYMLAHPNHWIIDLKAEQAGEPTAQ